MTLRDKYQQAISVAQQVNIQGATVEESGGRLTLKGTVRSQAEKNRLLEAIRAVPGWESEVALDVRVSEAGAAADAGAGRTQHTTYVVKHGDTLSGIAKDLLGNGNNYMEIFNANRDQLSDPDKIRPGQVLKIPQMANR